MGRKKDTTITQLIENHVNPEELTEWEVLYQKLTTKQQIFVDHYVVCWNGAEAARKAGYAVASARTQAVYILANPNVKRLIEIHRESYNPADMKNQLLEYLMGVLQMDIDDLMKITGKGHAQVMEMLPKAKRGGNGRYINSISFGKQGMRVQLMSKDKAAEMFGKIIGAFEKDNEQLNPLGGAGGGMVVYIPDNGRGDMVQAEGKK